MKKILFILLLIFVLGGCNLDTSINDYETKEPTQTVKPGADDKNQGESDNKEEGSNENDQEAENNQQGSNNNQNESEKNPNVDNNQGEDDKNDDNVENNNQGSNDGNQGGSNEGSGETVNPDENNQNNPGSDLGNDNEDSSDNQGGSNEGSGESNPGEEVDPSEPIITNKIDNLTISSTVTGYSKNGSNILFTKAGEYTISGSFNGSLIFQVDTVEDVILHLKNVTISTNADHAIQWLNETGKIEIKAVSGTTNVLRVSAKTGGDKNVIDSKNNVEIGGSGKLTIQGLQGHAVKGSNIKVKGNVNLFISAVKDGLHGKKITISGGITVIEGCNDAIEANYNSNDLKGTILLEEGTLTVNNCKRAFRAEDTVTVAQLEGSTLIVNINNSVVCDDKTGDFVYQSGTLKIDGKDYK